MRCSLSVLVALFLALPNSLHAQAKSTAEPLAPGARVRVTHPGEGRRVGTIVAVTAETLSVRWAHGADSARLPLDQVTRLEVSRGLQRGSRLARTATGFLIGTGSGLLLGIVSARDTCSSNDLGCSVAGGAAAMFFGLLGGGIGAAVGAATTGEHERWDRVPVPQRHVSLSLEQRGRGGRIGLTLPLPTASR